MSIFEIFEILSIFEILWILKFCQFWNFVNFWNFGNFWNCLEFLKFSDIVDLIWKGKIDRKVQQMNREYANYVRLCNKMATLSSQFGHERIANQINQFLPCLLSSRNSQTKYELVALNKSINQFHQLKIYQLTFKNQITIKSTWNH